MTNKKIVGKYFEDFNGIIKIIGIHNEYIYDYAECVIDESGNIVETENSGYITSQELTHYTEI